jgi:hypothetical protein
MGASPKVNLFGSLPNDDNLDNLHAWKINFFEVLVESKLFIDKKVIFDEIFFRRYTNFVIRITLFPFNLETSTFQDNPG